MTRWEASTNFIQENMLLEIEIIANKLTRSKIISGKMI